MTASNLINPETGLIAWAVAAYILYARSSALPAEDKPGRIAATNVLRNRAAFIFLVVAPPIFIYTLFGIRIPALRFISLDSFQTWLAPSIALSILAAEVSFAIPKKPKDLQNYPQYLPPRWTILTISAEVASWAGYLFAYEYFFRGVLLESLLPAGVPIAVVVSTALYAFAHLSKSTKEAFGALILGIPLALLTLSWKSVIPATMIHVAFAVGYDFACVRRIRKM